MLHLEVNKSIIKLDDGEVLGVVGSGRDITEGREKLIQSGKDVDVFKENEALKTRMYNYGSKYR